MKNIALCAVLCATLAAGSTLRVSAQEPSVPEADLATQADLLRSEGAPAVGLAKISCQSVDLAVSGVKDITSAKSIGKEAVFNIGSNAKSMLAVVAARLDQQGSLSLDAPLSTLWPQMASSHPDKADITLRQLLAHTSGLPAFDNGDALGKVPITEGSEKQIRLSAAEYFLSQPLDAKPGEKVIYSNAGYVIASSLLEHVSGSELKRLLQAHVFEPFGFLGAIGEPRTLSANGLVGHYVSDGKITPYLDDEPPIPTFLQGAGYVSVTLADYAHYVQEHLCALQGEGRVLTKAIAQHLHARQEGADEPLGWGKTEIGGSVVSFHIGGTGAFTAFAALSEAQDKAVVALVSAGGAPAAKAQEWLIKSISP